MSGEPDAVRVSSSKTAPATTSPSGTPASAPVDLEGRYRMRGRFSGGVIGAYLVLVVLILAVVGPRVSGRYVWAVYFLLGITLLLLARYLSVRYAIDDTNLIARTLFGSKRVLLEDVRAIEYANLRDLAPTGGLLASWVWRGRMFSPTIGDFELVFTEAVSGLLVTAGAYPLYISPRHPQEFARELSRRVRSYTGPLLKDVGAPVAVVP